VGTRETTYLADGWVQRENHHGLRWVQERPRTWRMGGSNVRTTTVCGALGLGSRKMRISEEYLMRKSCDDATSPPSYSPTAPGIGISV
jgi:hypothetical protein